MDLLPVQEALPPPSPPQQFKAGLTLSENRGRNCTSGFLFPLDSQMPETRLLISALPSIRQSALHTFPVESSNSAEAATGWGASEPQMQLLLFGRRRPGRLLPPILREEEQRLGSAPLGFCLLPAHASKGSAQRPPWKQSP